MNPEQIKALQTELVRRGANIIVNGILGADTVAAMNRAVSDSLATNPAAASLLAQNNPDSIVNAYFTNDWSGVTDITGKPFSPEDQAAAVKKAEEAYAPGFTASEDFDTRDTQAKLEEQNKGFMRDQDTAATNFQADKTNLDQNAADRGVLFSGSRVQKEKNLKTQYEKDQDARLDTLGSNISSIGSNFQYKYGDTAAKNPTLSQFYTAPTKQTFNPNVARGGVGTTGTLSKLYDPTSRNYQGTVPVANKAAVQTRAASLLTNKANKIAPYGFKTQL